METKNIILKLRMQKGLSQYELAEKIMVTRQAVSRWENGETVPNTLQFPASICRPAGRRCRRTLQPMRYIQ